jgi:hypothetical protein
MPTRVTDVSPVATRFGGAAEDMTGASNVTLNEVVPMPEQTVRVTANREPVPTDGRHMTLVGVAQAVVRHIEAPTAADGVRSSVANPRPCTVTRIPLVGAIFFPRREEITGESNDMLIDDVPTTESAVIAEYGCPQWAVTALDREPTQKTVVSVTHDTLAQPNIGSTTDGVASKLPKLNPNTVWNAKPDRAMFSVSIAVKTGASNEKLAELVPTAPAMVAPRTSASPTPPIPRHTILV